MGGHGGRTGVAIFDSAGAFFGDELGFGGVELLGSSFVLANGRPPLEVSEPLGLVASGDAGFCVFVATGSELPAPTVLPPFSFAAYLLSLRVFACRLEGAIHLSSSSEEIGSLFGLS